MNNVSIDTIKAKLQRMFDEDQSMQKAGSIWDEAVHVGHIAELKRIIEELGGWPTISLVGKIPSLAAWLIVQHSDHSLDFQKKCLVQMTAVLKEDIDKQCIPYLDDRIAIAENRPQKYGTQFYMDENGEMSPSPIVDLENLDERRRSVGLEPFAKHQKARREFLKKQ